MGHQQKTAIRMDSLSLGTTGPRTLLGAEMHGKRADKSSQKRAKFDEAPLVHGTRDLRQAYEKHVEGARMSKNIRYPVLHHLIQFPIPPHGPDEEPPRPTRTEAAEMMELAIKFINETYREPAATDGERQPRDVGPAVFAARVDRDERGAYTVDVFSTPKYEKRRKRAADDEPGVIWVTTTRHGRLLCKKHAKEINRRCPRPGQEGEEPPRQEGEDLAEEEEPAPLDGPRQVGIALQSEWRDFLTRHRPGLTLAPKKEKDPGPPDRVSPEEFQDVKDAAAARDKARAAAEELKIAARCRRAALAAITSGAYRPGEVPGQWFRGSAAEGEREKIQATHGGFPTHVWWRTSAEGPAVWEEMRQLAAVCDRREKLLAEATTLETTTLPPLRTEKAALEESLPRLRGEATELETETLPQLRLDAAEATRLAGVAKKAREEAKTAKSEMAAREKQFAAERAAFGAGVALIAERAADPIPTAEELPGASHRWDIRDRQRFDAERAAISIAWPRQLWDALCRLAAPLRAGETALAERETDVANRETAVNECENCLGGALDEVRHGCHRPEQEPGTWVQVREPDDEQRKFWDIWESWLTHDFWRTDEGRELWATIVLPASTLAGSRFDPALAETRADAPQDRESNTYDLPAP